MSVTSGVCFCEWRKDEIRWTIQLMALGKVTQKILFSHISGFKEVHLKSGTFVCVYFSVYVQFAVQWHDGMHCVGCRKWTILQCCRIHSNGVTPWPRTCCRFWIRLRTGSANWKRPSFQSTRRLATCREDTKVSFGWYVTGSVCSDLLLFTIMSMFTHTHTHLMAICPGLPGWAGTRKVNQSGFYWSQRQWVAVASSGPYASLHLAPSRSPRQHPTTQFFYRLDALPAVKALKA